MIGLTSYQLTTDFINFSTARLNQLTGQLEALAAGENPEAARQLKELSERIPEFNIEQVGAIFGIVMALMDTIVSNNEALAKTIPHLEV